MPSDSAVTCVGCGGRFLREREHHVFCRRCAPSILVRRRRRAARRARYVFAQLSATERGAGT